MTIQIKFLKFSKVFLAKLIASIEFRKKDFGKEFTLSEKKS